MKSKAAPARRSGPRGFVLTLEMALLSSIVVLGMVVGIVAIRDALFAELVDVAQAIDELNTSFSFSGVIFTDANGNTLATLPGFSQADLLDFDAGQGGGIMFDVAASPEP